MAKRGSTIPQNAQVPMAIALIVVFAAVLFWRFALRAERTVEAAGQSDEASIVSTIQEAELKSLIERVELGMPGRDVDPWEWEPLKRDPFVPANAFSSELHRNTALGYPIAGEYGDAISSRQEFLENAALSGVFVMGSQSVVILNKRYLHLGDEVGGFVVTWIFDDRIILEDSLGLETLRVGEPYREKLEELVEEASL